MTAAHKTQAIVVLAGLVAGAAALFSRGAPALETARPGDLAVRARLESTHLLRGVSETYLAVTITAPDHVKTHARPPINLAIVIDRSGSMEGEKLLHAKQAAHELIERLGPADRVSVVAYGSTVDLQLPSTQATPDGKQAAYLAIENIREDGGTNLSGGLDSGRAQLVEHAMSRAVERVVLISDGLANEGIIDRPGLAQLAAETSARGISITTVGVGLDFDEQTMTQIAVSGRGSYYFVEDSALLAEMFSSEFDRLGATAATDLRVALAPAPGVEIVEALGYPLVREGGAVRIPVADLHAGETRKVVLRLRVDARESGTRALTDIRIAYLPVGLSGDTHAPRVVEMKARATITDDMHAVRDGRDVDAIRHIERARTAAALAEATVEFEAGNAAAAQAIITTRQAEVMVIAEDVGADDLGAELEKVTGSAQKNFADGAAAPRGSVKGRRASKANRYDAYQLSR